MSSTESRPAASTEDEAERLRAKGISPSAQRVAVAQYVLHTDAHPTADEVWSRVRASFPQVSRATVYNTLNLFVERGLLREFALTEGALVFDPRLDAHHHFIDEDTGRIFDVPWDDVQVSGVTELANYEVSEFQVVLRGRKRADDA